METVSSSCRRAAGGLRELTARLLPWGTSEGATDSRVHGLEPSPEFEAAAAALRRTVLPIHTAKQLHLYALYKQTTAGDAPRTARMSADILSAGAKWGAWNHVRGTPAAEAMRNYVLAVHRELEAGAVPAVRTRRSASSGDDGLAGLGDDSDDGLAGLGDLDDPDAAVGTIGGPGAVSRMQHAFGYAAL